jgi:hypothetical protein
MIQALIMSDDSLKSKLCTDISYNTCIAECSNFKDYESVKQWLLSQANLSDFEFEESAIWQAEKNYRKMAESFSISQVPTILIRGTYIVDANSAGSLERLIAITDALLKKTQDTVKNE